MPTIKTLTLLFTIMFLHACTKPQLLVQELNSEQQGVTTHSINIKNQDDKQNTLLICFSEVGKNKLMGISCQNDTGFHLFSGGMKGPNFELEKVSQFVLKIDTQTIVSYMKIALFSKYNILKAAKHNLNITKDLGKTMINDPRNQRIVVINIL